MAAINERDTAELLAKKLQSSNAGTGIDFRVISKEDCGFEGHDNAAGWLVVLVTLDKAEIVDPLTSECGRGTVDPEEAYGITRKDALAILKHNGISL